MLWRLSVRLVRIRCVRIRRSIHMILRWHLCAGRKELRSTTIRMNSPLRFRGRVTDPKLHSTWLQTSDGCYVTQYDLTTYNGTCEGTRLGLHDCGEQRIGTNHSVSDETDLSFCGPDSTEKHITLDTATVKFDSECNLCPDNLDCEVVNYLSPGTELSVTCWTDKGQAVVGNS